MLTEGQIMSIANELAIFMESLDAQQMKNDSLLFRLWDIAEKQGISIEDLVTLFEKERVTDIIGYANAMILLGAINES